MSDPERGLWESLEAQWREDGRLPDEARHAAVEAPELYGRWLLLERLFAPRDTGLSSIERLQHPSPQELQRGARAVMAQLAASPEAMTSAVTLASVEEVASFEHAKTPILSTPEDADSSVASLKSPALWSRLMPLYAGACMAMLLLLVVRQVPDLLPPTQRPQLAPPIKRGFVPVPPPRPYVGVKGQGGHQDPAWLRLFFGVSAAHLAQPQRRGRPGMFVRPKEWLYFMFEKAPVSGFLTLMQIAPEGQRSLQLKQLFPAPGQSAPVTSAQRKWVLSVKQVALRFQIPPLHRASGTSGRGLAFVGLLSSGPLTVEGLRRLKRIVSSWRGTAELTEARRLSLSKIMGISPRRMATFHVLYQRPTPGRKRPGGVR